MIFYKVATTGLNPARNGVHRITFAHEGAFVDLSMKTDKEISKEALGVSGITTLDNFRPEAEVVKDIATWLQARTDIKHQLVGWYNASFDDLFLKALFARNGLYWGDYFYSNSIDLMSVASFKMQAMRADMLDFKIGTVAQKLGVEHSTSALPGSVQAVRNIKSIYDALV